MKNLLMILGIVFFLFAGIVSAQNFGGFGSSTPTAQDDLPIMQPTPIVDVPPSPMDFGKDFDSDESDDGN